MSSSLPPTPRFYQVHCSTVPINKDLMMLQNLCMIVAAPLVLFKGLNRLLIEMDKGICLFDAVLCYDSSSLGN